MSTRRPLAAGWSRSKTRVRAATARAERPSLNWSATRQADFMRDKAELAASLAAHST
jgi:hypothetical protein